MSATAGAALRAELGRALGGRVTDLRTVSGGDINSAFEATLADGRRCFVKSNSDADADMFPAEAHGLAFLTAACALRIPRVLATGGGASTGAPAFLILERIGRGLASPDFDQRLGRGLAELHRFGAPRFGLDRDNFIGSLPQDNRPVATDVWADFYRERRLRPQLARAVDAGLANARLRRDFDRLFANLEDRVGPSEPPARLHGDLWAGNHLCDEAGDPVLIDPAVYGGHREIDLAMMRLFGGYGASVFAAYEESFPLAPGAPDRIALYQLYPLLVHVNLFGGGYLGQVEAALARLV